MLLLNTKKLIRDSYSLQLKIDAMTFLAKSNLEKIQAYFDINKVAELEVDADADTEHSLIAKKSERVTIEYYTDKLKENLDPEIFNEIVVKSYQITDMKGLTKLLKSSGVSPADFKKFIRVDQSVNRSEIKRLYDEKEITKKDIKGCYLAKVSKSIKITRKKDG